MERDDGLEIRQSKEGREMNGQHDRARDLRVAQRRSSEDMTHHSPGVLHHLYYTSLLQGEKPHPQKALRACGGTVPPGNGVGLRRLRELKQRQSEERGWGLGPNSSSSGPAAGLERSVARRYVCVLALAAVLLLGIAAVSRSNGVRGNERQRASPIPSQFSQEERVAMKEGLKGAIQIPTVSFSPNKFNTTALAEFGEHLRKVFPTVFKTSFIRHEVVGEYSHLFTVHSSDASLQPYLLLAHTDVVPAAGEGWDVPLFSGLERDGFMYETTSPEDLSSLLWAVSGAKGAQKISALLQARGVQLAFIVDESSFIVDGFIPNLKKPFAMVAISEKGAINLMLQVNMTPGHSSAPPKETSIGILVAATRAETNAKHVGSGPLKMTLQQLANEFPFPINIVLSNLWLFQPLVNVIPSVAQAVFNFQIHPAQIVQEVLECVKNIVADDRVQFHVLSAFDPLPVSPSDDQAFGYQLLRHTIQSAFPEVHIVAPGICIGNTDSRHYTNLTTGIYQFNPLYLQPQDFHSIHGINEKISVQAYETQVKFIFEFIQNAEADWGPVPHLHKLCGGEASRIGVPDAGPGPTNGKANVDETFGQNHIVIHHPPALLAPELTQEQGQGVGEGQRNLHPLTDRHLLPSCPCLKGIWLVCLTLVI
ncbi:hypothetical protein HPG69_005345 [Diceros bicornis minor]|uniref:Peptidase M20 dimerisation domain-containing protein n=1 Tax=Diceros bicornis minor TaxID=77932 RepID=A0A7J7EL80_DICBM|nr:hypothetical protein HPG69_005345 [Diceros bicornis minor]